MKKIIYNSLIIIILVLSACTERIEINTDDAEPRLVIFGAISDEIGAHRITISKSTGYFSNEAPPAITNAVVTITSSENEVFTLTEIIYNVYRPEDIDSLTPIGTVGSGIYETDATFRAAKYGLIYTLDVWLDFDGNGEIEHYQAQSTMPHGPRVDSIALSPIVIDKMPILFLYGEVFHDTPNNFCIYTSKNNNDNVPLGLFDYFAILDESMIKTFGNIYPLPYFARGGINVGDTVNFRVDDLNNDYAVFLSQCKSEMGMKTPFFSSPPAEVVTNIKCLNADIKVSGFFAAYDRGIDMTTISTINFKFMEQ
ncbi:MAG: DUF4249 domain-containing protein [Prevotellaceae bacterium]|jgi:hypothetical protein|nr:DUF4249 domain-containing protein [Prevotellaceae bacterium]